MSKAMPKFTFKPSITDEDLKKAEQETKVASVGKIFKPGQYHLKITEFVHHTSETNPNGVSKADPTWLVYKMVVGGIDTRSISTFVLVPTKDLTFNVGVSKNPKFMAIKFVEFLRAVGLPDNVDAMGNVLQYITEKPEGLVGRDITVTIGYTGNHVMYNPENRQYSLLNRRGKEIVEGASFADRESAIAQAMELGLDIKSFPEITRMAARPADTTGNDW